MEELERWPDDALPDYGLAKRAHAQLGPDGAQLARMLARLDAPGAAAADASMGDGAVRAPGAGTPWLWLVSLIALLGAAGWLAGTPWRQPAVQAPSVRAPDRTPAAPAVAAAPSVTEPAREVIAPAPPAAETAAPVVAREARTPRRPAVRATVAREEPPAPDPLAELALLERARRVLARDPARALALTDEHRQSFAAPSFGEERELLAIEALLRQGQRPAAQRRADAFRRDYPGSVHTHRLGVILRRGRRLHVRRAQPHPDLRRQRQPLRCGRKARDYAELAARAAV